MSTAAEFTWSAHDPRTELRPLFDCAPLGLAQCQRQGNVTALNPALEQMLGGRSSLPPALCFGDLIHPQDRPEGERFFCDCSNGNVTTFNLIRKPTAPIAVRCAGRPGARLPRTASPTMFSSAQRMLRMTGIPPSAFEDQMRSDMRETLTAILLSCELAMSVPDVPDPAVEKIRAIDNLARELRHRLQAN